MANARSNILHFTVGKVYSFNTYAPEVLGLKVTNSRCLAVMNAQNAISRGVDIVAMHARMRPHLPAGYNNDPYTMTYVEFENTSGLRTHMAMDWINMSTVEETDPNRIVATIDGVGPQDIDIIRGILVQQGYTNISLVLSER